MIGRLTPRAGTITAGSVPVRAALTRDGTAWQLALGDDDVIVRSGANGRWVGLTYRAASADLERVIAGNMQLSQYLNALTRRTQARAAADALLGERVRRTFGRIR